MANPQINQEPANEARLLVVDGQRKAKTMSGMSGFVMSEYKTFSAYPGHLSTYLGQ